MIGQLSFCEIEQTGITEQGALRPKRAFLRARKEKFLKIFGQVIILFVYQLSSVYIAINGKAGITTSPS